MALISGSKGEGARRGPWRDGGRGKRVSPDWAKQARHAVESIAELPEPVVTLRYVGDQQNPVGKNIYRFDQSMARLGVDYFAEYKGIWWGFDITVSEQHEEAVRRAIAGLESARD